MARAGIHLGVPFLGATAILQGARIALGHPGSRGLGVAALVSWLLAESLGAFMFRSWLASVWWQRQGGAVHEASFLRAGGREDGGQDGASGGLIVGHATLALAGFVCWVSFLATEIPAMAWLAIGFLAPAIGLGISTVTVWTPYPVHRPISRARSPAPPPPDTRPEGTPGILVTNEMLDRVLANDALTGELVDDLVAKLLAEPVQSPQVSRRWQLAPAVPILHGILAIATFLLAMLAAINAVA
jgi:hypothetical protein